MVTRATTTHPDIPAGKTLLQPFLLAQSRDQTLRQTRSLCSKGTFFVLSLTSEDAPNQTQAHLVLLNSPHRPFRLNSTFSSTRLPAQPHLEGHFNLPLAEVPPRWPRGPPYPLHRPTRQSWQCLHLQPRQMLLERKKLHFCTHGPAYLAKNQGFEKIAYFLKKPQALALLYMFSTPTHIYWFLLGTGLINHCGNCISFPNHSPKMLMTMGSQSSSFSVLLKWARHSVFTKMMNHTLSLTYLCTLPNTLHVEF